MSGFIDFEDNRGNANNDFCGVMSMFKPENIPIITTLAKEYAIMDRFFCSHPGPTWPNRMYTIAGTSAGSTSTGTWYKDQKGALFPQETIFDQIAAAGGTWRNYYNDTPWEMFMAGIADHPENLASMDKFWTDAREGSLPSYAWINPRSGINVTSGVGSNDQHPDHDVAAGERYIKDIYEALRASPQWNETLLIVTYDEHGGFYDHVVPPSTGVPPPSLDEVSYPDRGFHFDRLGIRIPTLLISPWISQGTVISAPPEPQKPTASSEYDLTSIMATARMLLGVDTELKHQNRSVNLTARDGWSATFEHVFTERDAPRTDCPAHLPAAPAPARPPKGSRAHTQLEYEASLPLNDLQLDLVAVHDHFTAQAAASTGLPMSLHSVVHGKQASVSQFYSDRLPHFFANRTRARSFHQLEVVCQPSKNFKAGSDMDWSMLPLDDAPSQAGGAVTLSLRNARTVRSGTYCLDSGHGYSGVFVTECVLGQSAQQWHHGTDATLRPFASQDLCVTISDPNTIHGNTTVGLAPCNGVTVEQQFAFHGKAPGDPHGSGQLMYGDDANFIGAQPKLN